MKRPTILAIILAGGAGRRLGALTDQRSKPALPFGGHYRLIDIPLSNLKHSHIPDVLDRRAVPAVLAERPHFERPPLGPGPDQRRAADPAALPECRGRGLR